MDNLILATFVPATRTRDAIRQIDRLRLGIMESKYTLAAWFREHGRAAPSNEQKRQAYDDLLGEEVNIRTRG